jgi:uncharacterized Fe-S cluster-containing MiaB family protein
MKKAIKIIEDVEGLLAELKEVIGKGHSRSNQKQESVSAKHGGLAGEIYLLVKEGFFDEPRALSDIQKRLRLDGIKKPTTTLTKPLLKLLKAKVIKREESQNGKGPFKYLRRGE